MPSAAAKAIAVAMRPRFLLNSVSTFLSPVVFTRALVAGAYRLLYAWAQGNRARRAVKEGRMKLSRQILACVAAALLAGTALAQSYPLKPVRLIVGFPAGGPTDIFGRTFAQALSAGLGQTVIVENKSGVGGVLGIDAVAKASPDGYTLGFNNQGSVSMAPYALTRMPFNPNKDLALITTVVRVPEVVVVNPSLPVASLAELIAYAKANPGKINFSSACAGGITHLARDLLHADARVAQLPLPHHG